MSRTTAGAAEPLPNVRVALALICLIGLGCEEPASVASAPVEPAPEPLAVEIQEAQALLPPPPPSAWPTEIEDLRETIRSFTDVDACLASLRGRTPTEISEAVSDLRYDAFFEDVCGSMGAIQDGSTDACDALSVSTAQRGCRRRLALFHGRPGACPEDRVVSGREPVCVAWASRDEDLCQAASSIDRARCHAVMSADPSRCSRARGGDRVRCEAEIVRYGAALGEQRRESPAAVSTRELQLEIDGATLTRDTVSRGLRLVNEGCRTRIVVAGSPGVLRLGRETGSFSLSLLLPAQVELPVELPLGPSAAFLEVSTRRRGQLSSASGARGHVTITSYERRLGGEIRGTIEGELTQATAHIAVRGRFVSFVRDLDAFDDACPR